MTSDQVALIERAQESADAARILLDESYPPFAASRAYYAMFYVAEALLLGRGLSFSSHAAVISAYGKHFAKTAILPPEFHRHLIDGQDRRLAGDYDIRPDTSEAEAAAMIEEATAFIAHATDYLRPGSA